MRVSEVKTIENLFGNLINFKTFFILFLFTLAFGWTVDGLAEIVKIGFGKLGKENIFPFVQLGSGAVVSVLLYFWAKKALEKFKDVNIDVKSHSPKKTKNLILFLSPLNAKLEELEEIKSLEDFKDKKISWEMPTVAINHHLPKLENVIVITSDRSFNQFDEFKKFTKRLFRNKNINIERYKEQVDFEDIEKVYEALQNAIKTLRKTGKAKRKSDIIIDVTGGQKIPSIAGAIITLEEENNEFQYVSTTTKKVIGFDVLLVKKE